MNLAANTQGLGPSEILGQGNTERGQRLAKRQAAAFGGNSVRKEATHLPGSPSRAPLAREAKNALTTALPLNTAFSEEPPG